MSTKLFDSSKNNQKPSENQKMTTLWQCLPKSILEDFDQNISVFKPNEMRSYLSSNIWFIRGTLGKEISVCKVYNKQLLSPNHQNYYLVSELNFCNQVMFQSLKNDNLIQILKIISNQKNIMIFMEDYERTALQLIAERGPQNEELCKTISKQILSAIDYLHSRGISHRNIKLENIYLKSNEKTYSSKLADFSCAITCTEGTQILLDNTWIGTEEYMSPEILERKPHNPRKSDIWSFGVSLFLLLHNCFPFGSGDQIRSDSGRDQMLNNQLLRRYLIPDSIKLSSNCNQMFRFLMTPEFESRPDSQTALGDSWLN